MGATSENPRISVQKALHKELIPQLPFLTAGESVGLGEQMVLKWRGGRGERNVSYIGKDSEMLFVVEQSKTGIHANHMLSLPTLADSRQNTFLTLPFQVVHLEGTIGALIKAEFDL